MPEPRKTKDDLPAKRLQEATDFLTMAAKAQTADGKLFDPAAPAPGEYKVTMLKGMAFAGNRKATVDLLNAAFAPATFTF